MINEARGSTFTLTLETPLVKDNTGTFDYDELTNIPSINGVELQGDISLDDLGILNKPLTAGDIDAIIDAADEE